MVQIQILQGKLAGSEFAAGHFPFCIGRASNAGVRLEEPGVWDRHLELRLDVGKGISIQIQENAHATINGEPFKTAVMRNGDIVDLGSVKVRFWLAKATRRNLVWREWMVWAMVTGVALAQIAIVYWLTLAE